ncbi:SDR family NAD(P)-dependent oxidoreductase [Nonomuraea sp. NPDC004297]
MTDLTNAAVLITGGAQGIGLSLARAFAAAGARLALVDRDRERLDAAQAELAVTTRVRTYVLDVRDAAAFDRVADEAEADLGPITVLCNNAGIGGVEGLTEESFPLWDDVLQINLGGTVNGLKAFLPRMLRRGGPGHIVNTASGAGLVQNGFPMYTGSKFAVVGISEALAAHPELIRAKIGVTVLCPGMVRTSIIANSATWHPGGEQNRHLTQQADALLHEAGIDPDAVGRQVIEAVRRNQLFVHTDRMLAAAITDRHTRLLEAMPPETERDRNVTAWFTAREQRRATSPAKPEVHDVVTSPSTNTTPPDAS